MRSSLKVHEEPINSTSWQIPHGTPWENLLRAGTAPQDETHGLKKKSIASHAEIQGRKSKNTKPISHNNRPARQSFPEYSSTMNGRPTTSRKKRIPLKKGVPQPSIPTEPSLEFYKNPSGAKVISLDDDSLEENEALEIRKRPPCRQNANICDLEDKVFTKLNGLMEPKSRERQPIKILPSKLRPPSRHKTPPKAIGLEYIPKKHQLEYPELDNMFDTLLPSPTSSDHPEEDPFSSTMPVNLNDRKETRKERTHSMIDPAEIKNLEAGIAREQRSASTKGKIKSREEKESNSNARAWSAKRQQKFIDIPLIVNKRQKNLYTATPTRRGKSNTTEIEDENCRFFEKRNIRINKMSKQKTIRAKSSVSKSKISQTLPFLSSLEPEFLNLFAKSDINF
ncbi:unnamed protein product [Blepharisma stoltei]|uniref:Uncharacterized protein n=1 Tax=Blepharisma stoltei TaxID=1481888 RepID=A0AAU9JUP7_9CILI|nr:unnamed protein product [Blepharisma stoltei]